MIIDNIKLEFLVKREEDLVLKEKAKPIKKNLSYFIRSFYFSYLRLKILIKKKKKVDKNTLNIALVRDDALGDYIVSTAAISMIKEKYPNSEIDVFASNKNYELVKNDPNISNTYIISDLSQKDILRIAKERAYDYFIALNNSKTSRNAKFSVCIAPNAVKAIQISHIRKDIYKKVFDKQVDLDNSQFSWAEKMTLLVSESLNSNADIKKYEPYIYLKAESYLRVSEFLKSNGFSYKLSPKVIFDRQVSYKELSGLPYIVLNISAGKETNDLNNEICIKFLQIFKEQYPDKKIFITSAPKDYGRAEEIVKMLNYSNILNYKSDLFDFIAFLAGAELLISPDTGTAHIAAAADINSVIIYPAEYHLIYWRPNSKKSKLLLSDDKQTVNGIKAEEIYECVKEFYSK